MLKSQSGTNAKCGNVRICAALEGLDEGIDVNLRVGQHLGEGARVVGDAGRLVDHQPGDDVDEVLFSHDRRYVEGAPEVGDA